VTGSDDVSSSNNSKLNITRLWHVWLGHNKEVELQVEDSQRVQDGTQDQPIIDSHDSDSGDDPQEEQEQYCD
jgi:hypothetical protein